MAAAALHLLAHLLLHVVVIPLLQPAAAAATIQHDHAAASAVVAEPAVEVPAGHFVHTRDLTAPKDTAVSDGDGPRRRQQWDFLGPSLLLGGTLAALMLAAIGHLASKALLASMLSAALSAVQLARPPPPRPG